MGKQKGKKGNGDRDSDFDPNESYRKYAEDDDEMSNYDVDMMKEDEIESENEYNISEEKYDEEASIDDDIGEVLALAENEDESDESLREDEDNNNTADQVYNFETVTINEQDPPQEDFLSLKWQKDSYEQQALEFDNEEDLLASFFPDEFFERISEMTNLYAMQSLSAENYENNKNLIIERIKLSKKAKNWKVTTPAEIKRYIGICLYMGINKLPEKKLYWSKDSFLSNTIIKKSISRTRFESLTRYFHFNDNTLKSNSEEDPIFPVRPIINFLERIWAKNAISSEYVTIDETIIPYQGRLKIKQYVPRKPNRYGIKAYVLATSKEGYILKWNLYTGKDKFNKTTNDIIMNLMAGFENKGIKLFTDNYFTSVKLMENLEKIGVGLTGTVRNNRKITRNQIEFHKKDFNVIIAKRCTNPGSNFILTGWKDKREVLMLSNVYNHKIINDRRFRRTGKQEIFEKPLVFDKYNYYSHGVDLANQKASCYRVKGKSVKWYKYVFFYALEVHIVNLHILYKKIKEKEKGKILDLLDFRVDLIKSFMGITEDWRENKLDREETEENLNAKQYKNKGYVCQNTYNLPRLKERHFLTKMTKPQDNKRSNKSCHVCSNRKINRVSTSFMCKQCELPMCPTGCFEIFHTQLNYK